MRLENFGYRGILCIGLLLSAAATGHAADKKEWVTLNDCRYVDWKDNDGDSFRVHCGDKEFTARLYYVDTPETTLVYAERVRQQGVHFGITLDETLKIGVQAKERVQALLEKPFVLHTRWAIAGGRSREGRYYAIVEVDGRSLGEILVSEGLAWAKGTAPNLPSGEKAHAYMERLAALEDEARTKGVGAWSSATKEKTDTGSKKE
jgi:endonuclease YncB( thermonuclease family)